MKSLLVVGLVALFATAAHAQLVVDFDLGVLGEGNHAITGTTVGAGDEASNYPPRTSTSTAWKEDVVFQFTTSADWIFQLLPNAISGDPDFFLLNSLETSTDGRRSALGLVTSDYLDSMTPGVPYALAAGTYYLSVDAFAGPAPGNSTNKTGPFDVTVSLTSPPTVSHLGDLPLDDGFYAREGVPPADHPYGQLAFVVDRTGPYDITAEWFRRAGEFDGYLHLFSSPFAGDDAAAIASNDDFSGDTSRSRIESVRLVAGVPYYLVGTTYFGEPADLSLRGRIALSGPGAVAVIPEPHTALLTLLGLCGGKGCRRRRA